MYRGFLLDRTDSLLETRKYIVSRRSTEFTRRKSDAADLELGLAAASEEAAAVAAVRVKEVEEEIKGTTEKARVRRKRHNQMFLKPFPPLPLLPVPIQILDEMPIAHVHMLFITLRLTEAYVTTHGKLDGVITRDMLKQVILRHADPLKILLTKLGFLFGSGARWDGASVRVYRLTPTDWVFFFF